MITLEQLLAFHEERGSLSEFGPLSKLADAIGKATSAMQETLAAEAAAAEARAEATRIHMMPLTQSIGSPDDLVIWSIDGRMPMFDGFEVEGVRHEFLRGESLFLFVVPAHLAHTVPLREAMGWSYCYAREVLRLHELGGSNALQSIVSVPLGLVIYRHLAASTDRFVKAAAETMRSRLIQLGRDVSQQALPQASFFREWAAQDRAANRLYAMIAAASPTGTIEALPNDPDDVRRALADQQTRDSLAKLQAAELARADQANREATASAELLAHMAADIADLKRHATSNVTEIPQ